MTTELPPSTARIYIFPDRRRANASVGAGAPTAQPSTPGKRIVSGAWYHEEAIASAEPQPKR